MSDDGHKHSWADDRPADLDLGAGFYGWFYNWAPDRDLNPQYDGIPDSKPSGLFLEHPDARDPSKLCAGAVNFDSPGMRAASPNRPKWTVESIDPLTLSPSILCTEAKGGCGAHGYIRDGRWVAA